MDAVMWKALSMIAVVVLGYVLKRVGFFKPEDQQVIARVTINVVVPCAIINGFSSATMDLSFMWLALLGFGANLVLIGVALLLNWNADRERKGFVVLNYSGYNIGAFVLPIVQTFLGPQAVVATCLFDIGGAFVACGGSYAIGSAIAGKGGCSLRSIVTKLVSTAPFDTYVCMVLLAMAGITLPAPVLAFTNLVGAANGFMCMLMLGMAFDWLFEKTYLWTVVQAIGMRLVCNGAMAAAVYRFAPLPLEMRQGVAIALMAPIAVLAVAFTGKMEGNTTLAAMINSVGIVVGVLALLVMIPLLNIG
ncbi:MAG: AEC family transporter [Eubacteriales bacterium]|jgi:predicted permease